MISPSTRLSSWSALSLQGERFRFHYQLPVVFYAEPAVRNRPGFHELMEWFRCFLDTVSATLDRFDLHILLKKNAAFLPLSKLKRQAGGRFSDSVISTDPIHASEDIYKPVLNDLP
jgi:hypothetical protein